MKTALIKTICGALAVAALSTTAHAQLLITEINSNAGAGDFWELTNFSTSSINLFNGSTHWSWDDNSFVAGSIQIPLGITIGPGESIVFLADKNSSAVASFRSAWSLPSSVQVIPDPTGTGLGGGDAVRLYNDLNQPVVTLNYAAGGFIRSSGANSTGGHAGPSAGGSSDSQSLIWDPTFGNTPGDARYTFATGSNFGTYAPLSGGGFGSPGTVGITLPVPEPSSALLLCSSLLLVHLRRRRQA